MSREDARNAVPSLRFVPSRVEGLTDVSEAVFRPNRLELLSGGKWVIITIIKMARWPRPVRLRRLLSKFGWRPRWLPIADRDWFHPPRDRFFRFYTDPPLKVFLADEDQEIGYGETLFRRVQEMIESGGFNTYDLG